MTRVVIIRGNDYPFGLYAETVNELLNAEDDLTSEIVPEISFLGSRELHEYDVLFYANPLAKQQWGPEGKTMHSPWFPLLTDQEKQGLLSFVEGGKGLSAMHYPTWNVTWDLHRLLGGTGNWHPPIAEIEVIVRDANHPIMQGVGGFKIVDEHYQMGWDPVVHVLAHVDWYDRHLPVAWTHQYGKGKVFYTSLGHDERAFAIPEFQRMLVQGTRWVAPS